MISAKSQSAWKASLAVLYSVAILLTIFRLFHRLRTHRFWWDDGSASFSLIAAGIFFVSLWFQPVVGDPKWRIIMLWMAFFPPVLSTCSTRVSLALSIARVLPPQHPVRRTVPVLIVFLCLASMGIIIWAFVRSMPHTNWHRNASVADQGLGIAILCENLLSDIYLVVTPLCLFWRVRLPRAPKRLILGGFAATTLCTLATVVTIIFAFRMPWSGFYDPQLLGMAVHLETAVSLAVCNFLVVVTFAYGVLHPGQDLESSETNENTRSVTVRTTTHFDSAPPLSFTRPSEMHLSSITTSTFPSVGSHSISQK